MKFLKNIGFGLLLVFFQTSCMSDWLEVKSDKKIVVPSSYSDFQALLDNSSVMMFGIVPALGEISGDEYYLPNDRWQAHAVIWEKNAYQWNPQIFVDNNGSNNWSGLYQKIYYANLVLEGLSNDVSSAAGEIRGAALFYRAWCYFQLSLIFCELFDELTAKDKLGLPLKLNTDLEERLNRSSLLETYDRILKDAEEAAGLLPAQVTIKTRPGKAAGFALLSKIYLMQGQYEQALTYCEKAMKLGAVLIDYNKVTNPLYNYPLKAFNEEVIFHGAVIVSNIMSHTRMRVNPELYEMYDTGDLRKGVFYTEVADGIRYKGSYFGGATNFGGVAWDELYLVKAECEARLGSLKQACSTLNQLLVKRMTVDSFEPFTSEVQEEVLNRILKERRKELVFRGIRWADIRRLNHFHHQNISIKRTIDGREVILPAMDKKFVMPIPDMVVELGGYQQNER